MVGMASALSLMMLATGGIEKVGYFLPETGDFRRQEIQRAEGERDWPFVAQSGTLACAMIMGQPKVYFVPVAFAHKRGLLLDVNIFAMVLTNVGVNDAFTPYKTEEELIRRIAPFVAMGQMLCKQPAGPVVPGNEL